MSIYLDTIDVELLRLMQGDAKLTNKEIGYLLSRSPSAIFDRIKRLQYEEVIQGSTILIDHDKISSSFISYTHVQLKNHSNESLRIFEMEISDFEEVTECANITGNFDYMLKVIVPDMRTYHDFLRNKLGKIANLATVQTNTVLSESKASCVYPLSHLKLNYKDPSRRPR